MAMGAQMGSMQRSKGGRGEREARDELKRLFGCEAERGQQRCGGPDSPDVKTSISGVHFEVKRTEKLRLWEAMDQACRDTGTNIPVVLHRPNSRPWIAIIYLNDLPKLSGILEDSLSTSKKSQCVN